MQNRQLELNYFYVLDDPLSLSFELWRLQEIGHEVSQKEAPRRRSNSLPVPKIQVSFHADVSEGKTKDHEGSENSSSDHNYISGRNR